MTEEPEEETEEVMDLEARLLEAVEGGVEDHGPGTPVGDGWRAKQTSCDKAGQVFADFIGALVLQVSEDTEDGIICQWGFETVEQKLDSPVGVLGVTTSTTGRDEIVDPDDADPAWTMGLEKLEVPTATERGLLVTQLDARNDAGSLLSKAVKVSLPVSRDDYGISGDSVSVTLSMPQAEPDPQQLALLLLELTEKRH